MAQASHSESLAEFIDGKLSDGTWTQWRRSPLPAETNLPAAARAWCASSHWDRNTPNLEDWRTVAADLAPEVLSENDLAQMALTSRHRISFPPIPFFEERQVKDLLKVSDVGAATLLAEQLMGLNSLLTVRPTDAASLCWKSAVEPKGMDYATWGWLIRGEYRVERPLPSRAGLRELWEIEGPRGEQARALLAESAAAGAGNGDPGAEALLAAIAALQRLAEPVTPRVPEPIVPEAEPSSPASRYEGLCNQLFHQSPEMGEWEELEAEAERRAGQGLERHPLSEMAHWMQELDLPIGLDDQAWENIALVFEQCPGLMKAEVALGLLPLPALELAACVRSTVSIGEVAVGLVLLAEKHRADTAWWEALWAGLQQPLARRGGWPLANDRPGFAKDAVRAQRRWLSEPERNALDGVVREGDS